MTIWHLCSKPSRRNCWDFHGLFPDPGDSFTRLQHRKKNTLIKTCSIVSVALENNRNISSIRLVNSRQQASSKKTGKYLLSCPLQRRNLGSPPLSDSCRSRCLMSFKAKFRRLTRHIHYLLMGQNVVLTRAYQSFKCGVGMWWSTFTPDGLTRVYMITGVRGREGRRKG